jgi:NTE family protein
MARQMKFRDQERGRIRQHAKRYDVAFVLSGGAARGALQIGMLEVLLTRGIVPNLIVGTSVGAFNGAWLAAHPTVAGVKGLADVWSRVRFEDIFSGGPMGVVLHLVRHRPSLYTDYGIRRFLARTAQEGDFQDHDFEHLQIPLAVVTTNLTRGRPEIFERGPLASALLASAAIPAVLPPVTINGEQYLDGGLLDNVGLRVAIERGARRIYVLDTSWDGLAEKPASTFESVIQRSLQVVTAFHLQSALEYYSHLADVVVIRDEHGVGHSSSDFQATAELVAAGRAAAERVLAAPERESARSISRGRALRSSWPRFPAWEAWMSSAAVRQAFGSRILSLPERVQLFAQSLGISVPPRAAPTQRSQGRDVADGSDLQKEAS